MRSGGNAEYLSFTARFARGAKFAESFLFLVSVERPKTKNQLALSSNLFNSTGLILFRKNILHLKTVDTNAGKLVLKNATVRWFLSVNSDYIPPSIKEEGQTTFRSIKIDGNEIEFSTGFKDLHTRSYEEILSGNGFGLDEVYNSIQIVSKIRKSDVVGLKGDYHPLAKKVI